MKLRQELSAREVEHLHESLARRLGDTSVPTLPQVAVRIIELVANPDSTFTEFADVIQTDQALTGRILRMANSAAFAQKQQVTSLHRAAVLMGMDRLKAMSLGFHLSKQAAKDNGEFSFKRTWTQSLFRAALAFRLAERFNPKVAGEAFIVGLMLDVGIPMMSKLAGDRYRQLVRPTDPPGKQYMSEFCNLPMTHVDVVSVLAKMWRLPELLQKPIVQHHSAADRIDPKSIDSLLHGIAYLVGAMPLDPEGRLGANPPMGALIRRIFDLEPPALEPVLRQAAADFAATREMFSHIIDESLSIESILDRANMQLNDAVENLVEDDLSKAVPGTVRFEAAGMILEIEPAAEHRVVVYLADQSGARLLSEQIDPRGQTEDSIRSLLLLEEASTEEVAQILSTIQRLAA